jgi:Flp pilus assembly pilin Flp
MSSVRRSPLSRPRHRRGFLTFEWILLVTLLVIGIVAGVAAVRDAVLGEMTDMAQAIQALFASPPDPNDPNATGGPPVTCPPGSNCSGLPQFP